MSCVIALQVCHVTPLALQSLIRRGDITTVYHAERLYNLTDEAVRACPTNTRWVLVTNGDNAYADSFFDALLRAPADADVIAFDYYSRYRRSTGPPCLRFQSDVATPPCKRNKYGPWMLPISSV